MNPISDRDVFNAVVCLHVIVTIADVICRSLLQVAVVMLVSCIEKYNMQQSSETLATPHGGIQFQIFTVSACYMLGTLKQLHAFLLRSLNRHKEKRILHPKLSELCKRLPTVLQKPDVGATQNRKVLQ